MKITEIKQNPGNPRLIKDDKFKKLCKSIEEFPQMMELRPIIVDADGVILGGNMRYQALKHNGVKDLPVDWVRRADDLTEEEKKRFIITDNSSFGEYDWDMIANEWDDLPLGDWGLDVLEMSASVAEGDFDDSFTLKDGDKEPFQQMTFTLADEQAEQIRQAISDTKKTVEFEYMETMGNENGNGNALYLIVTQWAEQKKLS